MGIHCSSLGIHREEVEALQLEVAIPVPSKVPFQRVDFLWGHPCRPKWLHLLIFDLLFLLSIITWNSFRRMKRKTMKRDPVALGHLDQHVTHRDHVVQIKVQAHAKRSPVVLLRDCTCPMS